MIRPEAKERLYQWREAVMGLGLIVLGLYWALSFYGILQWIGLILIPCGVTLIYIGVQRARFRQNADGPGIVAVVEGQISYFGPDTGGVIDIEDISRISLKSIAGQNGWWLEQAAQPSLFVPVNARGAEALFDVFTMLPNLNIDHMVHKLSQKDIHEILIWQKDSYLEPNRYLH